MRRPIRTYIVAVDPLRLSGSAPDLEAHPDLRIVGRSVITGELPRECVRARAQVALVLAGPVPVEALWVIGAMRSGRPRVESVALTEQPFEADSIQALLTAGARGILRETASKDEIHRAVRAAVDGGCVFGPEAAEVVLDRASRAQQEHLGVPLESLDLDILSLLAGGSSRSQVAQRLGVDSGTVLSTLRSAKVALKQRTQEGVIAAAIRKGLI